MGLLIIVIALCALALIAPRFGQDSRDRPHSSEEDAASWGMTWVGLF
jgi:hypothetical protein